MRANLAGPRTLGVALGLLGLSGCAVGADLLNPGLLSSLGFDPFSLGGGQGSVIILLQNSTARDAFISYGYSLDSGATANSRENTVFVPSDDSVNEVLTCPVAFVRAGGVGAVSGTATDAAFLVDLLDPTLIDITVQYSTSGVSTGDFTCGDVIVIELTGTDGTGFGVSMRVVPGQ